MQPPCIAASASASLPFISVLVILSPLLVDNTLDGEHHIGTDQGTAETGNAVLDSLDVYWVITFEIDPGIIDGENRFRADGDTKSAAFTAVDCYMRYTPSASHDHLRARGQRSLFVFYYNKYF